MSATIDPLEHELLHDLGTLEERITDDSFAEDLYRALANTRWRKAGGPAGRVSLSWNRAEEVTNDLRARAGQPTLTLAQTGGEGEVAGRVAEALGELGWSAAPLDTGRHDDRHAGEPSSPPPGGSGEPPEWERRAHEEAEANRRAR